MKTITVALGNRSYPIHVGEGILEQAPDLLAAANVRGKMVIVTDSNVGPLYAEGLSELLGGGPAICALPAGEEHKRLDRVEWLCGRFLKAGLDRSSVVVALGGGVVGDVAGFAASVFMRGVRFVQVPTTIVAQVDSSVGGKTGVNHALAKNVLGAFHQPSVVIIDTAFLKTLPVREICAGLAEVVKHGMIADADLFAHCERDASAMKNRDLAALEWPIVRSCEIKSEIVGQDEREEGVRANLNYGHTFGHAIEAVTEYKTYLHGEALAIGMHAAAVLATELGMVDDALVSRQRACLAQCGLPTGWPELPIAETLAAMRLDKKVRAGTLKFVLPDRLGHVVRRTDVDGDLVRKALESLRMN